MADIEVNLGRPVHNPYAGGPDGNLPGDKYFTAMKRLIYVGISLFGLRHFDAYQVVLHSPHVSHEWFKVGLAATIGA